MTSAQVAKRFRLALEMYEFGEQTARSTLRRRHREGSEEQITQMLREWRQARPGAPSGDAARVAVAPVQVNVLEAALRRISSDLERCHRRWAAATFRSTRLTRLVPGMAFLIRPVA